MTKKQNIVANDLSSSFFEGTKIQHEKRSSFTNIIRLKNILWNVNFVCMCTLVPLVSGKSTMRLYQNNMHRFPQQYLKCYCSLFRSMNMDIFHRKFLSLTILGFHNQISYEKYLRVAFCMCTCPKSRSLCRANDSCKFFEFFQRYLQSLEL